MQQNNKTIAYILKGFPRLSETFIANEIYLLEKLGTRLKLYSIKRGETGLRHAVIDKIVSPLIYVPRMTSLSGHHLIPWLANNTVVVFGHHIKLLSVNPLRYFRALRRSLGLSWKHRLGPVRLRKVFIKEFLQAGYIAREILKDPNILHIHAHFCHGATTVAWFVSDFTGLPFSFTAHAKDIYQKNLNPGDLLSRKLAAAKFVTTCTRANHAHLSALHHHPENVHAIYHGLDTAKFIRSDATAQNQSVPLLLAVGRHVEKKGFIYLIDACEKLRKAGVQFQCQIIGEPGDQTETIRAAIKEKSLAQQVSLKNAVTQEQLKTLYQAASIFVLPCIITDDGDRDGIPNVMAEAMATSLPVISTPISGIPELIQHDVNGLLVTPRDSDMLAEALQRVIQDNQLQRKLGRAARQTVCEVFDSKVTTKDLYSLLLSDAQQVCLS